MFPKSLPVEIWDQVVYGIDSGRDLLSLALVSRPLGSIILPHHLPFCHIRGWDIRRQYVWEYLVAHPPCARAGVILALKAPDSNSLDLIVEDFFQHPKLPPVLTQQIQDRSAHIDPSIVAALVKALSYMTTISIFTWKFTNSEKLSDVTNIIHALLNGPICLRALSLYWQFGFGDNPNFLPVCISICFKYGSWTKLRRLSLHLLNHMSDVVERETIVADFFQRQPNLESLVSTADLSSPRLSVSSLQMLRSVWFDVPYTTGGSFLSEDVLSNIVHYKTNARYFNRVVKMYLTSSYEYSTTDRTDFVRNAPKLRKINLLGPLSPMDIKRWVAALATSSRVAHVYLSATFHSEEAEKIIKQFSRIKTLQYMQLYIWNRCEPHLPRVYEEIRRDSSGKLIRHHDVPYSKSEIGPSPSEWEDFFCGIIIFI